MSVEFKHPLPSTSSQKTVGVFVEGRFMKGGRHDISVEIWSAPSEIGTGTVEPGWRESQVCLAVSQQTALTIPIKEKPRL